MPTLRPEDEARRLVAAAGGRCTGPRLALLAGLLAARRPLSHAELHRRHPAIDRVTVYRALDWLAANGLAHRLCDPAGVQRYAANGGAGSGSHRHPHFHCTRCGATTCLAASAARAPRLPRGFRPAAVEVLVSGVCGACAAAPG